jgi:hypothetical protein
VLDSCWKSETGIQGFEGEVRHLAGKLEYGISYFDATLGQGARSLLKIWTSLVQVPGRDAGLPLEIRNRDSI